MQLANLQVNHLPTGGFNRSGPD